MVSSAPRLDESRSYYEHQIRITEAYIFEMDKVIETAPLERERGRSALKRLKGMLANHLKLEHDIGHATHGALS
jgi:hypothetical protein